MTTVAQVAKLGGFEDPDTFLLAEKEFARRYGCEPRQAGRVRAYRGKARMSANDPMDPFGEDPVRVRWACSHFIAGGTDLNGELPECGNEFETVEDPDEWEEKGCSAQCPACKSTLTQQDDFPTRIA